VRDHFAGDRIAELRQAFEVHALDYLTKPVEPERLQATQLRMKERIVSHRALQTQGQLKSMLASLETGSVPRREYPNRFLVPNGSMVCFVNVSDIEGIEAEDIYSCLHVGQKNIMLRKTIKHLADTLDPQKFVRVHRSSSIWIRCVRSFARAKAKDPRFSPKDNGSE
jgi:two-component system LytT family response regulator